MKSTFVSLTLFFCVGLAWSQVKIGDSPETIDGASLLELESNSRTLVITRVTDAQMNSIVPLQGALVFNIDENCVFQYNGTNWTNLCNDTTNLSFVLNGEELVLTDSAGNEVSVTLEGVAGQTFSTDPIVNFNETIVITQDGNNFNFEVGEITGDNIVDSSINGVDLQDNSITDEKLAANSVGQEELQDNAVTDAEIDYTLVTVSDFDNDAGYITAAQLISPNPNNAITDDNGAFYDDSVIVNDIAANATNIANHIATDTDLDPDNERLSNADLDGTELVLTEGATETRVDLGPILGDANTDEQDLANVLGQGNDANNVTITNLPAPTLDSDAATKLYVDNAILTGGADGNDFVTGGTLAGETLNLTGTGAAGGPVDLSDFALDTDLIGLDASDTNELTDLDFDPLTNVLSLTNPATGPGGSVDLSSLAGGTGSTEVADQATITGIGTVGDPFTIEPSATLGQFLRTDPITGDVIWDDLPTGTGGAVNSDGLTIVGDGVATDLQVADGGIGTLQLADDAVTADQINPNVAGDGLNQNASGALEIIPGTAADQILKWNGTNWALGADLTGGATVTDADANDGLSTFDPATGYDINVDGATIELDGDALQVPDDGIGVDQIDAAVAGDGLNQNASGALEIIPGTAADQILKWNGTNWALGADLTGGVTVTDADANDGLSTFDPATGYDINVDGATIELDGDALQVPDDGIGVDQIDAAVAGDGLNQNASGALEIIPGTAADQILKWNGTNWALGADLTGGATVTDADANDGLSTFDPTSGYDINVDGTTIVLDGDALEVSDDGIGVDQIDAAVAGNGLNQNASGALEIIPGTAADQILKWNDATATWELGTDLTGGAAVTDADANDGLSTFDPATGYDINVDGTTIALVGDALEVPDDAITTDKILDANITEAKIAQGAADQILRTNPAGTLVEWVDLDASGVPVTDTADNFTSTDVEGALAELASASGLTPFLEGSVPFSDATGSLTEQNDLTDGPITTGNEKFIYKNGTLGIGTTFLNPTSRLGTRLDLVMNDAGALGLPPFSYPLRLRNAEDTGRGVGILFSVNFTEDIARGALTYESIANGRGSFHFLQTYRGPSATEPGSFSSNTDAVLTITNGLNDSDGNGISDFEDGDGAGRVGIGTRTPTQKLHINRNMRLEGAFYDSNNEPGTAGQVLSSTETGTDWVDAGTGDDDQTGTEVNLTTALDVDGDAADEITVEDAIIDLAIENFAESDLTLDATRTHDLAGNNLVFNGAGQVGIGGITPQDKLDVDGQIRARNGFAATEGSFGNPSYGFYTNGDTDTGMFRVREDEIGFSSGGVETVRINADRNVGIGLDFTPPGTVINANAKLHVFGNVYAENGDFYSASGAVDAGIPDYVFQNYFDGFSSLKEEYSFKTLGEIEQFVKQHKHLPGITSAKEAQVQGYWNLSKSNLQNLEKIEELFLHTIEQEKKIEKLVKENETLSTELNALKKDMAEIKALLVSQPNK